MSQSLPRQMQIKKIYVQLSALPTSIIPNTEGQQNSSHSLVFYCSVWLKPDVEKKTKPKI